jgi:hypothetical protein
MALKQEIEKQEQAEVAAREREYLDHVMPQVYAAFPDLVRCMAVEKMIVDFCGGAFAVEVEAVKLCMENEGPDGLPARLKGCSSKRDQKVALIEDIVELLEHNGPAFVKNETYRLGFWSVDQLIKRKAEIIAAQAAASSTTQSSTRSRRTFNQYEPLPSEGYVAPGKVRPVPWSFSLIKRLDRDETHRLIRRYGADAINQICNLNKLRGIS